MAVFAVPNPERDKNPKPPPNDLRSEAAVLSALILDASKFGCVAWLRREHFFSEAHGIVFEVIAELVEAERAVDVVTIASVLRERGRLEQVGGFASVTDLVDSTPAISNIASHGEIVFDLWRVRRTLQLAQLTIARIENGHGDVQEFIGDALGQLTLIAKRTARQTIVDNVEAIRRIVREIRDIAEEPARTGKRRIVGIKTGVWGLDSMTFGLHSGEKTTVTALPGRGKTAFALQVASHVAAQGIAVQFFSTEMSRDELLYRMLAARSRIPGQRLKQGSLSDPEWARMYAAQKEIESLPVWFDETSSLNVNDIRARAHVALERAKADKLPLGLIVVDYVQRLDAAPEVARRERHEQIGHATKGLKMLAQELKIPVLELAQEKDSEIDKISKVRPKPDTGWTAGCKTIGKESDVMIFLRRNPLTNGEGKIVGEDPNAITLILDKQRNGDTGEIQLAFRREFSTFEYVPGDVS